VVQVLLTPTIGGHWNVSCRKPLRARRRLAKPQGKSQRLVFKAHILLYLSTLGLRVIKKKKKVSKSQFFVETLAMHPSKGNFYPKDVTTILQKVTYKYC